MAEAHTPVERQITARALLVGERIDTQGLERDDVLCALPLTFRFGESGIVVLFRFGVAVLFGMSPLQEEELIHNLVGRIIAPYESRDQETAQIQLSSVGDDQILPTGVITLRRLTTEHVLLIADALATTVILAHDERSVSAVFGKIEPLARRLAEIGRTPARRGKIVRLIGNALLVQQRISGLVAVEEKPDVLWERPALERFYARLEDEYELKARAGILTRKLSVVSDSAKVLSDLIDTKRSLWLEMVIVVLIGLSIVIAALEFLSQK